MRQPDLTASVSGHLEGGAQKNTFLDTVHTADVVGEPRKHLLICLQLYIVPLTAGLIKSFQTPLDNALP